MMGGGPSAQTPGEALVAEFLELRPESPLVIELKVPDLKLDLVLFSTEIPV